MHWDGPKTSGGKLTRVNRCKGLTFNMTNVTVNTYVENYKAQPIKYMFTSVTLTCEITQKNNYNQTLRCSSYFCSLSWKNITKTIMAVTQTSLLVGRDSLTVWHIFKDSTPPFRSPPFGLRCSCMDSKAVCTLLYVALLLLVAKGSP